MVVVVIGPLRPHPANPRYFTDGTRPVFLAGSHTWANFATDQGPAVSYDRYLDFLSSRGHNFFPGWLWDLPTSDQGFNGGPFSFTPSAWLRTGHLHAYERSLPRRHPVGMTFQFEGGSDEALRESPADLISPDCTPAFRAAPPAADGSKVVIVDTDHGYDWRTLRADGPAGWTDWVWKTFCGGNNLLFMDPYLARIEIDGEVRNAPPGPQEPDPFWEPMRAAMGRVASLANRLDLASMIPHPELASTGYCLAAPGREYLVYAPAGTERFTVDLEPGDYTVTWMSASETRTCPGAGRTFRPPFDGGAAAHIRRAGRVRASAGPRGGWASTP